MLLTLVLAEGTCDENKAKAALAAAACVHQTPQHVNSTCNDSRYDAIALVKLS